MGSRCFVRGRIDRAVPIALAIVQVIASAIVPGIAAAIGRARRIVPKVVVIVRKPVVVIAPKPVAEIEPRLPIAAAAPRAEIAEAVAAGQ
jgi:hypothetical protein